MIKKVLSNFIYHNRTLQKCKVQQRKFLHTDPYYHYILKKGSVIRPPVLHYLSYSTQKLYLIPAFTPTFSVEVSNSWSSVRAASSP